MKPPEPTGTAQKITFGVESLVPNPPPVTAGCQRDGDLWKRTGRLGGIRREERRWLRRPPSLAGLSTCGDGDEVATSTGVVEAAARFDQHVQEAEDFSRRAAVSARNFWARAIASAQTRPGHCDNDRPSSTAGFEASGDEVLHVPEVPVVNV